MRGGDVWSEERKNTYVETERKTHSQDHLLLAERVFGFDLQLLDVLVSDLRSFSGAPALIGCGATTSDTLIMIN